jgi:hypothetical protein
MLPSKVFSVSPFECGAPSDRPAHLLAEDDSPYPEVRAAVANTDDPELPVSTVRSWVLGLIWAIVIAVCPPG